MDADTGQVRPQPNLNLLCCRACLATDEKLFYLHDHKLGQEFVRVTGISLRMDSNKMPQHLCGWCSSLLQRCASFRDKCLRANKCLLPQLLKGNLTTESVRAIDRYANKLVDLTRTEVEVIDCTEQVYQAIPVTLKNEVDSTGVKVNNTLKKDLYIEINSENKHEIKFNIVTENDIIDRIKPENLEDDAFDVDYPDMFDDNENISNTNLVTKQNTDNIVDNQDTETIKNNSNTRKRNADNLDIKVKKRKYRRKVADNVGEENFGEEIVKQKKIVKWRSAENDYLPLYDFKEIESAYNVNVVILTLEEQLAEISSRRGSAEYRRAPHPCAPCGRHFRLEHAYKNHMKKHARKAGQFECPVCKWRFKMRSKLQSHCDAHRFKFVCRECGFTSRTREQAKKHHEWHSGKTYECKYCGKLFNKPNSHLSHVRSTHSAMNVWCDMCGESFVNNYGLRLHRARMHAVAKKEKQMQCKTCSVTFTSLNALKQHKKGEHTGHSCVQCGENLASEEALKDHVAEKHPTCLECSATFLTPESYAVHYQRKHLGRGNAEGARRSAAARRARLLGRPPPYPAPCSPRRQKQAKQVCCETCGQLFWCAAVLRYHQRIHTEGKLHFACPSCPKSFLSSQQLKSHSRVHTGEKPYKCAQCDLDFSLKSNLRRHMLAVHMGIRRKTACGICGRVLASPFAVKLHIRTVHNGEPWPKRARRKKKTQSTES